MSVGITNYNIQLLTRTIKQPFDLYPNFVIFRLIALIIELNVSYHTDFTDINTA